MLATTATASATRVTQASSRRANSSILMAEISSSAARTWVEAAAPRRTASAAEAGTYTVGVWPPERGSTT